MLCACSFPRRRKLQLTHLPHQRLGRAFPPPRARHLLFPLPLTLPPRCKLRPSRPPHRPWGRERHAIEQRHHVTPQHQEQPQPRLTRRRDPRHSVQCRPRSLPRPRMSHAPHYQRRAATVSRRPSVSITPQSLGSQTRSPSLRAHHAQAWTRALMQAALQGRNHHVHPQYMAPSHAPMSQQGDRRPEPQHRSTSVPQAHHSHVARAQRRWWLDSIR
jgi:hypothetical protein